MIEILKNHLTKGSLIYVVIHAKKHFYNKPGNKEQFKHFFSQPTLHSVFTAKEFDTVFISQSIYLQSQQDKGIMQIWADSLVANEMISANQKDAFLKDRIHENKYASIEAIFRRR